MGRHVVSCQKQKKPFIINDIVDTGTQTADGYPVLFLTYFHVLPTAGQMDEEKIISELIFFGPCVNGL